MIKVHYNDTTGEVIGFYPDTLSYSSIPEPFVEITNEEHERSFGKRMAVVDGAFKEYQPSLEEKKNILRQSLIASRKKYLKDTDWQASAFIKYGRPIDEEVKIKSAKAAEEINNIQACTSLTSLNKFSEVFE